MATIVSARMKSSEPLESRISLLSLHYLRCLSCTGQTMWLSYLSERVSGGLCTDNLHFIPAALCSSLERCWQSALPTGRYIQYTQGVSLWRSAAVSVDQPRRLHGIVPGQSFRNSAQGCEGCLYTACGTSSASKRIYC